MSGMSNEDAIGRLSSATVAGGMVLGLLGVRSTFFFGAAVLLGGATCGKGGSAIVAAIKAGTLAHVLWLTSITEITVVASHVHASNPPCSNTCLRRSERLLGQKRNHQM